MIGPTAMLLWRALAVLTLSLGVVGLVLPVLPTVPFLIVAAWAAGRGWPALETWLLAHPVHGVHIRRWRERGAVSRRAKWLASLAMLGSALMILASGLPPSLKLAVPALTAGVALWLWLRPEQ